MLYNFLKLIRYQNLLIVIVTQCIMRWCIIEPILKVNNFQLQFSTINFFLLVLATVFLTAGGYVINDYFDTKTDILNRPNTVIIGKQIKRRTAIIIHTTLNIIAILIGLYISIRIHLYQLGFIFVLVSGILWFYSTTYKRQFLIGNIIVAILTGLVPMMVVLYEVPLLNTTYRATLLEFHTNFYNLFYWVAGFSFFAFITTLSREIIKDVEDFEGDTAYGRRTIPIVMGVTYTKIFIIFLELVTIGGLLFVYFGFLNDHITQWYMLFALILPMLFLVYKIIRAKTKSDYHFANILSKIIMLAGILYSFIAWYIFTSVLTNQVNP
jgi:4-hydroxybenzoate polyprenyltransferase